MLTSNTGFRTLLYTNSPRYTPITIPNGTNTLGYWDSEFRNSGYDVSSEGGIWVQFAVVGTNSSQTFYINGSQVGSTIAFGAGGTTHWGWGNNNLTGQPWGHVANMYFYNRQLSLSEITQQYNFLAPRFVEQTPTPTPTVTPTNTPTPTPTPTETPLYSYGVHLGGTYLDPYTACQNQTVDSIFYSINPTLNVGDVLYADVELLSVYVTEIGNYFIIEDEENRYAIDTDNLGSIISLTNCNTIQPTSTPTVTPTITPTATPTETPTSTPTPTPTPTVTSTPTPTLTITSTPLPVTGYGFNLVVLPYTFPTTGNTIMNQGVIQTGSTDPSMLATNGRGIYWNSIDSDGIDRTDYYSQFTGQTITVSMTQGLSTVIYSGDTSSFKLWDESPSSGFVFGTGIGLPPVGSPSGVATLIQSGTTWNVGEPVYISVSTNS
jgi:hypothetical protein